MAPRTAQLAEPEYRRQILDAALSRFLKYGYNKTTMSEIAEDAHTSAANLYRFFENKGDIAATCCDVSMKRRLAQTRNATQKPATLEAKLTAYVRAMIDYAHEIADSDTKFGELIDTVTETRPEMIRERLRGHYALLAEILHSASDRDAYNVSDCERTATYLHSAFAMFDLPIFVSLFSRSELEERAAGVIELVVHGLRQTR